MATASKNIFWLSVSRVAALVLLFLAYARLFRYLGPHASGQYQFVLSFVTIFGIIVDFGIQQYIIKKISEEPDQAKRYFHNFLAVEVLLVTVIYCAMAIVGKLGNYEPAVYHAILVAGLGTALNGLTYPFLAVMNSFHDLRKVALINFINSLVNVAIIFCTIYFGQGIVFLASNQMIFAVLGLIMYRQFVTKHIPQPDVGKAIASLDWKLVSGIFKAALPFALLVGFSTVYNRIDVVLITKILGYTATGFYTAAYKFFDLLGFFPSVVSFSLYPVFAGLMAKKALPEIRATLEQYLRFLMAVAIPMAVGAMLLSREIILVLAGKDFLPAASTLAILVWAPAILFVYIVVNSIVISQLTRFAVMITSANVVINVIGNLLLLPRYGIHGAAIMTVVSETLQGVFYFYFVRQKITRYKFWSLLWRPALSATAMGGLIWLVKPWLTGFADTLFSSESLKGSGLVLAGMVAFGFVVYAVCLAILGFFQSDDINFVKHALRLEKGGSLEQG